MPGEPRQKTGWQVHAYCLMNCTGWVGGKRIWSRATSATPAKVGVAVRRRKQTMLSVKGIAARLHLGTPGSASVCLLAAMRTTTPGSPTQAHLAISKQMQGRG